MKSKSLRYFLALPTLLLALSAQAHDPKEHMKEALAPDCAPMKEMDHSNMDMQDPVMQAMMQKCMKAMHQDENGSHDDGRKQATDKQSSEANTPGRHQH